MNDDFPRDEKIDDVVLRKMLKEAEAAQRAGWKATRDEEKKNEHSTTVMRIEFEKDAQQA